MKRKTVAMVVVAALGAAVSGLPATAQTRPAGVRGDFGMGPPTTVEMSAAAAAETPAIPAGPFAPNWDSIRAIYRVPQWFMDAKFGLFLHWGLYSVPAYHNEWYEKHMYASFADWHAEHFGPQEKFGYKDFIPLFTCAKFDPDQWAELFRKSGAKYVVPSAEHHDGFSLWDSQYNRWNAAKMGPKRDLIGELAKAVRKQGLKFGVSNHSIEHYTFINPKPGLKTDLDDPATQDFYWTQHSDERLKEFLELWVKKNEELVDKYQVDMLWFDNGINSRVYDPLKLRVAAYYYNRAKEWGKEVSLSTKDSAYLAGSILDFEKVFRGPRGVLEGAWQADDPIGSTWGYTKGMKVESGETIVRKLIDTVSKGGNLLLNLSPTADGTIPEDQQKSLLEVGQWLEKNGEAIYGTHAWIKPSEGSGRGAWRFTVKGNDLYAITMTWPGEEAKIESLASGKDVQGKVTGVTLLEAAAGGAGPGAPAVEFQQDGEGLKMKLPKEAPGEYGFAFKISGLTMNAPGPAVPAVPPAAEGRQR